MALTNKEIVEKINQSFNENDTEAFLAYCEDDVTWMMVGGAAMTGKDAIRKEMGMLDSEGKPQITVQHIIADDDLVASNGTLQMKKKTGEPHNAAFCDIYRFNNGKIREMTSYIIDFPSVPGNVSNKLAMELEATTTDLLNTLSTFKEEQINAVPFEGSWSAAQVADHLLKANGGILHTLRGKMQQTQRPVDKNDAAIKKVFLDFSIKMKSPKELVPSTFPLQKEAEINSLNTTMKGLQDASKTLDLSETCLDFELPGFGALTRLEWLYFCNYHTQRHTQQLKNIHNQLLA